MELFAIILLGLLGFAVVYFRRRSKTTDKDHPALLYMPMLTKRWDEIKAEIAEHGKPVSVPRWWNHKCTDAQLWRLKQSGVLIETTLTKGQCSDIIGTMEEPGEEDLKLLDFFGVEPDGDTEIEVKEQLRVLFKDPANREKWKNEYKLS